MVDNFTGLIPNLVEAIHIRKSTRNFLPKSIDEDARKKIEIFLKLLEVPFEHSVDISLHKVQEDSPLFFFKGMNNSKIFAAMISPDSIEEQAKLGFIGELLILYCESLGLSTCWFGHFKKKNTYKIVFGVPEKEAPKRIFCITPIGFPAEKKSLVEKISNKIFSTRKKSVEENLHEDSLKNFPEIIKESLDLSCKAPSALNKQFWYFNIRDLSNEFEVEISKPVGYKHLKWKHTNIDIGACAAHFWLGLKNKNARFEVTILKKEKRIVWLFKIPK